MDDDSLLCYENSGLMPYLLEHGPLAREGGSNHAGVVWLHDVSPLTNALVSGVTTATDWASGFPIYEFLETLCALVGTVVISHGKSHSP